MKSYESLKNSKQFNYFYNNSKKQHTESAIVFYRPTEKLQVGFTASKKVGNAVKRNFAKRRLRAFFGKECERLNIGTYIFVAKKEIIESEFAKLESDLKFALKKIGALQSV